MEDRDFRVIFESLPGLYMVITSAFRIVAVSDAYLSATMTTREDIKGRDMFDVFPDNPEDPTATGVKNLRASFNRVLQHKRRDVMAVQKYDIRRSGALPSSFEERFWSPVNSPVLDGNGEVQYIIHRVEDVTDYMRLQQMSERAQVSMAAEIHQRGKELQEVNDRLRSSIAEKDILLKEIHHRVKNNLQLITSLMSLQSDFANEDGIRGTLEETCNRVRAIAEIHELLYRSADFRHVDVPLFMERLCQQLLSFYNLSPERIRLTLDMNTFGVDMQSAVPLALILNELMCNSLKHAFPGNRRGSIHISTRLIRNVNRLCFADGGVGLPPGFDYKTAPSLGSQLISLLTEQLAGTMELQTPPGTRVIIDFPVNAA
jgi:PAS domain S-box-containing protein